MKKALCFLLIAAMLCASCFAETAVEPAFSGLNDPVLLPYLEDEFYDGLASRLDGEYAVEAVQAIYISQEYLDELAFNSRANVFFGYTLAELDERFQGTRYVFTLGDDGKTTVKAFEPQDEAMDELLARVAHNVAMGTGVILVCVTVSAVSTGVGAPVVSFIFGLAAKTGAACALSGGLLAATTAGIVAGLETGDMQKALEEAAYAGSEGFKWGAVSGAVRGAVQGVQIVRSLQETDRFAEGNPSRQDGQEGASQKDSDSGKQGENSGSADSQGFTLRDKPFPTPWESQEEAQRRYSNSISQVSYIKGVEVPYGTEGSTRPDLVRMIDDHLEAIEVKNYDLSNAVNRRSMYYEIKREVTERLANLPEGSTQRIVIDVRGRNYAEEILKDVELRIRQSLSGVYPDIPIDFMQ